MQTRTLGDHGLAVSALGLGTMGMTVAYGPSDEQESSKTIERAYDLGVTLFDTAELYGAGTGEQLLGRAVKRFRDEVVIATKFGFDLSAGARLGVDLDSRPDNIRQVAENSLRHLQTDVIDIFYQHRVDPLVPIEEVAGAVKELIDAGKVRCFGLSEAAPETIRRAHAVQPVTALQTEYSIFQREAAEAVLQTVRELGIGFVPYAPLGRGLSTADVKPASQYSEDDIRRIDGRWQGDNYTANPMAVDKLKELAASNGIAVTQLALAWLLAQGEDIVPIPGTRRPNRLEENVAAADITLTDGRVQRGTKCASCELVRVMPQRPQLGR